MGAMCATIHNSPRPLTVLSLGPMTNIAELVKMSGDTVSNAHLVRSFSGRLFGLRPMTKADATGVFPIDLGFRV